MEFISWVLGSVAGLLGITHEPKASWIVWIISKILGGDMPE